ncbi:23S rRNA (uracil(1939)-C(5))-methyltransferase RlmD [Helcococcus massiliensis]|uniref:23S rRNA (uracil(1939)-C(5))-methyltransferase RlmD n=1 Tax=Helcococcus massiliensis TaxID=2040290 RepID=UPI000CDF0C61|nr:23S rRNA (uracil(1939)-C(5))-methyltransferase RlmD [Helcococcus massiliensis]
MAIKVVKIIDMVLPNFSIGQDDEGKEYRFKGGVLGQKVLIKTGKKKAGYFSGKLLNIEEKSDLETLGNHDKLNELSGNKFENIPYEKELEIKKNMLTKLYKDLDWKEDIKLNPSPLISGYRNKMEYTFGDSEKDGPLILGMAKLGRFYEKVDYGGGSIANPDFDKIRKFTQEFFREKNINHHHKTRHEGELKFFIIRYSFYENAYMLNLVTKESEVINQNLLEEFIDRARQLDLDGEISSFFHTVSNSVADAVVAERVEKVWGKDYLTEKINGLIFRISPFSFFQPNPKGAENLYQRALEFAGDIENKIVYDLYCGTGTISQIFAKKAKEVVGVEIVEEAVEKAIENAKINELDNLVFKVNDVLKEIDSLTKKPDIVVVDPPRAGIHAEAIGKISKMQADKIVYISCNPVSQVEDIKLFEANGYRLEKLETFDQFPRTVHVEALVLMTRERE